MAYDEALNKAWGEIGRLVGDGAFQVRSLADTYSVNTKDRQDISLSCNIPAKAHITILILHYLISRIKGLPKVSGLWLSFKELDEGGIYFPAFRERAIEPIVRKYADNPQELLNRAKALGAKKEDLADAAVSFEAFDGVPVLVTLWAKDEEFDAEANMIFDKSISRIFVTEDVAVLGSAIAHSI